MGHDRTRFVSQNDLCLRSSLALLDLRSKEMAELHCWKIWHASRVAGAINVGVNTCKPDVALGNL